MANHKSAIKRARQNDKKRARNTAVRSKMKTELRGAAAAIATAKSREEALKALTAGDRAMQKAVTKGVVPKNRASRTVSRLAARVNAKFAA